MSSYEATLQLRVRYGECDPMGYAHHGSYVQWIEAGRIGFLRDLGYSYRELESQSIFMPVARLELEYKRPLHFEDRICVRTRLIQVGVCQVVFANRVERLLPEQRSVERLPVQSDASEELCTLARVELATVNRSGRPCRMPETLSAALRSRLSS